MKPAAVVPRTVDEYIARQPPKAQAALQRVRRTIHQAAPEVEDRISYQIPSFRLGTRYLIHVAAFKAHLGLYPAPKGDAAFNAALARYRSGKATVRFPLGAPIPLSLVTAIVKFRKLALLEAARKKAR